MSEDQCDFCAIVSGAAAAREVLRTSEAVAFLPDIPATLGHTLVIPVEHIRDIWSLDGNSSQHMTDVTLRVAEAVRATFEIDGLNIIQSNGEAATQSVFHLHVHVVPRRVDDAMGPIWPEDQVWSPAVLDRAQTNLRFSLNAS